MAFCTECGSKLPEEAQFCTNCGSRRKVYEAVVSASADDSFPNAARSSSEAVSVNAPEPVSEVSAEKGETVSPVTGGFVPPYKPGEYNFAPPPAAPTAPEKKRKDKTALIVILSVVALIVAVLVFVLVLNSRGNSFDNYFGYWESDEIDFGNGSFVDEYLGHSIDGIMGLQINSDGTIYLGSAFNSDIIDGSWEKSSNGISVVLNGQPVYVSFSDDELLLLDGKMAIKFEKSDKDINNPSIPFGSYSGSGSLPLPEGEEGSSADNGSTMVAGSGDVADGVFHVAIVGAEQAANIEGKPVIRVYYEFTNNFDYSISAWDALDFEAAQDGNALESSNSWDDSISEYNNSSLNIRPGVTILCFFECLYNPDGGNIDFSIFGWDDGKSGGVVTATYIPGSFPGRPSPYVIKPVADPKWTYDLPDSALLDEVYQVSVENAELAEDVDGDAAIRVFYKFTNNSDAPVSMRNTLYCYAYQDGIQLDETYSIGSITTDNRAYEEIQPGAVIECSLLFKLRSTSSPVEAEVESAYTHDAAGQTYKID